MPWKNTPEGRAKKAASDRIYRQTHKNTTPEFRAKKAANTRAWYQANRERALTRHKAYYQANKEREAEKRREWYKKNGDAVKAKLRATHAADPLPRRQKNRAWQIANPNAAKEILRRWKDANPERRKELGTLCAHRRRALLLKCEGSHTSKEWKDVLEAHGHRCHWCGAKGKLTRDHYIPLTRGGTNFASNLVPACRPCNSRKTDRDPVEFARSLGLLL